MSQRSPQNARYQKHTKPTGKTRRSAASAKPKKASAAPAAGSSAGKGSSARAKFVATPEYTKWRNRWWWLLGVATVLAIAYFPLYKMGAPKPVAYATIIGAYVFLGVGAWIDFKKVRPLRIQIELGGKRGKPDRTADKTDGGADE
jgi:hypothetical protein